MFGSIEYNRDLFNSSTTEKMIENLYILLNSLSPPIVVDDNDDDNNNNNIINI